MAWQNERDRYSLRALRQRKRVARCVSGVERGGAGLGAGVGVRLCLLPHVRLRTELGGAAG